MDDHDHAGARKRSRQAKGPIGPWVANLITHSTNTRFSDDLELVRRHKPPIVITALGSPEARCRSCMTTAGWCSRMS